MSKRIRKKEPPMQYLSSAPEDFYSCFHSSTYTCCFELQWTWWCIRVFIKNLLTNCFVFAMLPLDMKICRHGWQVSIRPLWTLKICYLVSDFCCLKRANLWFGATLWDKLDLKRRKFQVTNAGNVVLPVYKQRGAPFILNYICLNLLRCVLPYEFFHKKQQRYWHLI